MNLSRYALWSGPAAALLLLAGCGGNSASNANSGAAKMTNSGARAGKVTLTYWNGYTGPNRPAMETLVKKFNQTHAGIQVQMTITPWDSLLAKLPSALASGSGPDLMGIDFSYLPQYAQSGYILNLNSAYKSGKLSAKYFPKGLVKVLKYKGSYYGSPIDFNPLMMYYNKSIFKKAGLNPNSPPKNWTQWIADVKKTTKHTGGQDQYGLALGVHDTIPNWPILMWGEGGDVIINGKPGLTNSKTQKALTIWSNLQKQDKISPLNLAGADADKLFQTGKAAMEVTGPWATTGYTQAKVNYDVAPVPAGPAGPVTLADSNLMMVNAKSKNAAAAITFMNYWNSKSSQAYFAIHSGSPPDRTDLIHDSALKANPFVPKFASVLGSGRFYLPGQPKYSQIDTEIVVPLIQQITYGRMSVSQATKQYNQQLTQMLASSH
jgi:multiple sugar transport system substrate-binding protein